MLCNKYWGWVWKQGYAILAHRATITVPQEITWILHSPEPKAWPVTWKISLIGCGTKLIGSGGLTIFLVFHHSSCDLIAGVHFLLNTVQKIHHLKMALSSWQCSSQKSTLTNLLQCALCLKCSILTVRLADCQSSTCVFHSAPVSIIFLPYSVCRWKYMFRYFTESLEPYIWCLFYINFYTGEANSNYCFSFLACGPATGW